jgi:hypothetical protein
VPTVYPRRRPAQWARFRLSSLSYGGQVASPTPSAGPRSRFEFQTAKNFPPRDAPELCMHCSPKNQGRRERRVLAAPAVSRAMGRRKTHTSIQVQAEHPDVPCAMALRLMPCSPRRRIRLVTVACELTVYRNPGWASQTSADLTPATGARTTRFCRTRLRQSSARCDRSRALARPAITIARPTLPRPPQPAPTFVTMANAPLPGTGWLDF